MDSRLDIPRPFVNDNVPSNPKHFVVKFPKLILTLQADDSSQEGSIDFHRLTFMKIDPYVKVFYSEKANEYIVKFQNIDTAQDAYVKAL